MMEVHATSPLSPRQVMSPHLSSFGPIRRRSKRRTSPVLLEERSVRSSRSGSDRSPQTASPSRPFELGPRSVQQGAHGATFLSAIDSSTAVRNTGAPAGVEPVSQASESLVRAGAAYIGGAGCGTSRFELGGHAGPTDGHPASHYVSLPNTYELRARYDGAHYCQYSPDSYSHPQPQDGAHSHTHHGQPGPTSSHGVHWYGATQQHSSHYAPRSSTASGSRSPGASPRRLAPTTSPVPFPPPLLHAEISHLATAPDQTSPLSPPAPRDLSRLLHHRSQAKPVDPLTEGRPHQYNTVSSSPSDRDRYPLQQSSSLENLPGLGESLGPRANPPSSLATGSAGVGSSLVGFAGSFVHATVAESPPHTGTTSPGTLYYYHYPSTSALPALSAALNESSASDSSTQHRQHLQSPTTHAPEQYTLVSKRIDPSITALIHPSPYDHEFAQHHHRQHLNSANGTSLPSLTRTHAAYAHPAYDVGGPSENYTLTTNHAHAGAHRHPAYAGQSEMRNDSDSWLSLPGSATSAQAESQPHHVGDQHHYHQAHMVDSEVIPLFASNSIGEPWVDASVELSRREMENASQLAGGHRPAVSSKARRPDQKKTRGKFTEEKRKITAQTRKNGACIRCKCQRVRCEPSDANDPSAPCAACLKVNQQSKKMIHACICRRYRLQDMTLSRQGGLNFTTRWQGTSMKDVGDRVDDVIRIVELKIFYSHDPQRPDLYHHPIRLEVQRFQPREGDVLHRKWVTRDNVPMITPLTAFALHNINAAAADIDRFVCEHAFDAIRVAVRDSHPIVRETYEMAIRHFTSLPPAAEERPFLGYLFKLWFAMRLTTGSAYISGSDKLDMAPDLRPDYPLGDRISLPRMITAQVDSILTTRFLRHGVSKVSKYLETYLRSNNPKYWFTLYLANFILLHEISVATKDRARYARENQLPTRFSLPAVVREQHFSANNLLAHWHYYKTENDPSNVDRHRLQKTPMQSLTDEQQQFVWRWWRWMKQPGALDHFCPEDPREQEECLEEPLYFVSQMYMTGWKEKATFLG